MPAAIVNPPNTYQEWLDCFEYMRESKIDDDYIDLLSRGSLQSSRQMLDKFNTHLVNITNDMLDKRTKRFIKELNRLLEFNDIADTAVLFKNFSKSIRQCLFFYRMECVPIHFRKELLESVKKQTNDFLRKVLGHLSAQAVETNNLELEDALYQIRRIKFFPD